MLREELKNITIDELLSKNEISVRTRKFCNNSNIYSLFDIFDSYEKGRLFYEFKKAGIQTCLELQSLCKKYDTQLEISNLNSIKKEVQKKENKLEKMGINYFQYDNFESQLDSNYSEDKIKKIKVEHLRDKNFLSERATNYCITKGLDSLFKIVSYYAKKGAYIKNDIVYAGRSSCVELDNLCTSVDSIIANFQKTKKESSNINYANVSENDATCLEIFNPFQFLQKNELKKVKIEHLRDKKLLSERASNYCKTKRLDTLFKIVSYYEEKGTFLKNDITYAGEKTCIELDYLCKYLHSDNNIVELWKEHYPNINESKPSEKVVLTIVTKEQVQEDLKENDIKNKEEIITTRKSQAIKDNAQAKKILLIEEVKKILLDDLIDSFQISVRTKNCCHNAGFSSLFDIISGYEKHGMFYFRKIQGAGRKTLQELENLCKETLSNYEVETTNDKEPQRRFKRYEEIIKIIEELSEQERHLLFSLAYLILLKETVLEEKSKIYGRFCFENFVIDFFEKYHDLPMLWILEQSITENKDIKIDILLNSFKFFNDNPTFTLDQLASQYSKSRESIRQIRNRFFDTSSTFEKRNDDSVYIHKKKLIFIKVSEVFERICADDFNYLLSELEHNDVINQKSSEIQSLLKKEKCNFSIEFVLQIIAYIFPDKFVLFGGFDVWETSYRKKTWVNIFLIKKDLTVCFDFDKMREEFSNLLSNNDTEYFLDIESHVLNSTCWINFDYTKNEIIVEVIKEILLFEFGLYPELDGNYKIPANKKCNPFEVVYKILLQNGKPMHINEVFAEFKKAYPNHKYTDGAQLRPYLQKHDAISHRKRNSEYTLKEWEHIKTGTIRDAIVDFLDENNTPQKAQDIFDYVIQHFQETNVSSIRTTMYSDSKKRFSFFENNLFGLSSKDYTQEYIKIDTVSKPKSFEERLNDFEKFVVENEHFPYASSENKEELSLFRWWYRVNSDLQQINETQKAEVEKVKIQYAHYKIDKNIYEWMLNYNKLKIFLLENRRTPSARGNERPLYDLLRKIKEDFQNDNLSDAQRIKFIELAKLI